MKTLLIGAGSNRDKKLSQNGNSDWGELITLDMNADHKPTVVHNLEDIPLPFESGMFDEIHAYDTLEHVGQQGDWQFFFEQWNDFHRMLKPGGYFCGISPHWSSPWAWMDPGHTRVLGPEMLVFLHQPAYAEQVGRTPRTDYRFIYKADFDISYAEVREDHQFCFALKAVKPSRCLR